MTVGNEFKGFIDSVTAYADAYANLEEMQAELDFIPRHGDQKTGLIGEVYIYKYLEQLGYTNLEYGSTSNKGWDIRGYLDGGKVDIQVKTVSAFSKTRMISPIHPGWQHLYLLSLDRNFKPDGLWLIDHPNLIFQHGEERIASRKMATRNQTKRTGSASLFNHAEDIFKDFRICMGEYLTEQR
ncbi:hypothetical protein NC661_04485 [Aquibacillus koreensis]|uniref:Uncharacterized protein n=1 Tax=Aquibacillus koreensis TaxID=279446 RepID=A0A9X4AH52_9BACI|nr:hypothetical protein [Aquibacillus koreensis]MCT2534768.1 hypothetical protein [Aquibacillus koreensis]MDC3419621.1 hypothetical protein [Aquibacillus koreensis]